MESSATVDLRPTPETRPRLTLAVNHYDRHVPFLDGTVQPEGIDLQTLVVGQSVPGPHGADRHERMLNKGEFDIAEISLSSFLMAKDQAAPFAGIPVFPRRLFSCAQMYVRAGAGIRQPDDLAGRRVGLSRLCWKMASATPSGCHWPRSRRTRSPWLSISFGGRNRWVCRRCRTFRTHVVPSAKCVFMGAMPAGPQTRSASSVGHSTIGVIGPGPRADCRDVPAGVLIFGMTARSSPMSARRAASSETPTTRSPCEPRVWVPGHRAASTSSHSSCWCELASRRLTVPGRTGVPTGQPAKSPPERAVSLA